jgi:predicted Rossmann fold nucleotide-binding protein DprA/Smf involved in DNA uptake
MTYTPIFTGLQPVRSRRTDPATSKAAGDKAAQFAPTHSARIMEVLRQEQGTARDIAERTGLTVVQVDRRLPELQGAGLARPVPNAVIDGCRVWVAV